MGAKFNSSTCKATVLLVIAIVAALLASSGHADETHGGLLPESSETVPCDFLGFGARLPACIDWCNKQGHYGGGFVHQLCCCGPRLPPPQAAKNY
ncbi:unnamed protein product [Urochloa decumbens]|uniref:Uncharacterized protein n=1 Tax=Urochloa decumbens TaxID=240449 RepID=A0ABC9B2V6_9POAL